MKTLAEQIVAGLETLRAAMPNATLPEMLAAVAAAHTCAQKGTSAASLAAENARLNARVAELEAAAAANPPLPQQQAATMDNLKDATPAQLRSMVYRLIAENAELRVAKTKATAAQTLTERAQAALSAK